MPIIMPGMRRAPAPARNQKVLAGVQLGEDVTETLEVIPPVEGHPDVRERFSCRDCETITQPPFHTVPRGWVGPGSSPCSTSTASTSP